MAFFSNPSQALSVYTAMIPIYHISRASPMKISGTKCISNRRREMEILYSYRESNPDSLVDRPVYQPLY